jgi:hypothetical protein
MSNQITHRRMSTGGYLLEHIVEVKGINTNGSSFQNTVPEVVAYLKKGYQFHVHRGGYDIAVMYERSASGREYIKTKPDSTKVDNLLSLPVF